MSHKSEYIAYINSTEWKELRLDILQQRGNKCERCGLAKKVLQVHHLHYKNLYNEKPEDLQVVCRACHDELHSKKHLAKLRKAQANTKQAKIKAKFAAIDRRANKRTGKRLRKTGIYSER